jgi:hypothetical protein
MLLARAFPRRLALPVIGLIVLCALAVGPARAAAPVIGGASFGNVVNQIPANGTAYRVADIFADDDDPDAIHSFIAADGLEVVDQGQAIGTCTGVTVDGGLNIVSPSTPYSVVGVGLPYFFTQDFTPVKVGELHLTAPVTVDNNCIFRKAVVQVTFEEQDP